MTRQCFFCQQLKINCFGESQDKSVSRLLLRLVSVLLPPRCPRSAERNGFKSNRCGRGRLLRWAGSHRSFMSYDRFLRCRTKNAFLHSFPIFFILLVPLPPPSRSGFFITIAPQPSICDFFTLVLDGVITQESIKASVRPFAASSEIFPIHLYEAEAN